MADIQWPDPASITADEPKILWIELTSRCPYRCIFCSRALLRGDGAHMPFALYGSILGQLDSPEVMRLNYAGESLLYPHVVEAIRLAKAKGTTVEIVTALPPISQYRMEKLISSGLDLLTVSLHTMDPDQYPRIFGSGVIANSSGAFMSFDQTFEIPALDTDMVYVSFRTEHLYQPFLQGTGPDKRSLGFALMRAEIV
jgi:hypothetical protein